MRPAVAQVHSDLWDRMVYWKPRLRGTHRLPVWRRHVGAEEVSERLIAIPGDNRLQHVTPPVGVIDIAGADGTPAQLAPRLALPHLLLADICPERVPTESQA